MTDDIEAMRGDVADMEQHLQHLENENLLKLTGPLAGALARLHTGLNMAVLELAAIKRMMEEM